jgi:hypothetical protein
LHRQSVQEQRPARAFAGLALSNGLIAGDQDDLEVFVELNVHRVHLALGIVDLVNALGFFLEAFAIGAADISARAAFSFSMSAAGTLSSSSSANAIVLPKARTRAIAKAFIIGGFLYSG